MSASNFGSSAFIFFSMAFGAQIQYVFGVTRCGAAPQPVDDGRSQRVDMHLYVGRDNNIIYTENEF